jgi:hypothetical protein
MKNEQIKDVVDQVFAGEIEEISILVSMIADILYLVNLLFSFILIIA